MTPLGAQAVLAPAQVIALFGRGYTLRGTERVSLVRQGREAGQAAVSAGDASLRLDAATADALSGADGIRLVGPAGSSPAGSMAVHRPCLALPTGLRRAWGLPDAAVVALGPVAVRVTVTDAPAARLTVDRTLWLGAGSPDLARWLPGMDWPAGDEVAPDPQQEGIVTIPRRVVTETDIRQARLRGHRLRLSPGQVVTPAAQSLAREWNVWEPGGDAPMPASPNRR